MIIYHILIIVDSNLNSAWFLVHDFAVVIIFSTSMFISAYLPPKKNKK